MAAPPALRAARRQPADAASAESGVGKAAAALGLAGLCSCQEAQVRRLQHSLVLCKQLAHQQGRHRVA